mmetsp:Transcript_18726/g.53860  ORF Transcript_18726/g.53860 Transcript_18726/m.53860 type:complete len:416 (+) Transcript_18726:98-1345(+)
MLARQSNWRVITATHKKHEAKSLLRLFASLFALFLAAQSFIAYRSNHIVAPQAQGGADENIQHQEFSSQRNELARSLHAQEDKRSDFTVPVPRPTPDPFPPLESLVDLKGDDNKSVKPGADLRFLLDFAIVGFAKTGSTTISRYLRALGVSILNEECCYLVVNKTAKLTRYLYQALPHDMGESRMPRGLKCPQDLSSDLSLLNYEHNFGKTKLIVGIRSPLSFFQSFYNFRAVNTPWKELLPTQKLAKRCIPGSLGICGWRASFVDFLYKLGKTDGTFKERELLELNLNRVKQVGDVFIYELGQLSDTNQTRVRQFRQDLARFLGLHGEMPPIPHVNTLGRFDYIEAWKEEAHARKIDICDDEHIYARRILQDKTERTSKWIREYLLQSNEVFVSSRDYFTAIVKGWVDDPCRNR